VRFGETAEPGLYRLAAADEAGTESDGDGRFGEQVFAVKWAPEESALSPLTGDDIKNVNAHVPLFVARTTGEMTAALTGSIPGQEVWKQLVACALLTLLAEVLVARWITVQRRSHKPSEVDFGTVGPEPGDLRARLAPRPVPEHEQEEAIP
jgi:hypothetical protein